MAKSKVYFTDMRTTMENNLLGKLKKLILAAGIGDLPFEGRYTAIKLHFGEPGNLSFLRANYAKVVADTVKSFGGKPFLVDCNTLYAGRRKDALDHLDAAMENGFTPYSTGCQIIIGDGLKGLDEVIVPLEGTKHIRQAKIGRGIADADILISLSHFKGHELTGFGGAIKNLGMGCASRAGKMEQHRSGKPVVDRDACRGCRLCARHCAQNAIVYDASRKASIDHALCVGCGHCIAACNFDAIDTPNMNNNTVLSERIAEYTLAAVKDKPCFHICIAAQISPHCDCWGTNDTPIIPDVGMFASFDPVALDMACADACNKKTPLPDAQLIEAIEAHGDTAHEHFNNLYPHTDWETMLRHSEELGIGTTEYELVTLS